MKKTILWALLAIISGAVLGLLTFNRYKDFEVEKVISYNDNVYALYYGTYNTVEQMNNSMKDIDRYIYIKEGNMIKSYIALAANKKNIVKLKKVYKNIGINTKVVKVNIDNDEFIQNLNEYEKLLSATEKENSLIIIENQILSCYEELVVQDE